MEWGYLNWPCIFSRSCFRLSAHTPRSSAANTFPYQIRRSPTRRSCCGVTAAIRAMKAVSDCNFSLKWSYGHRETLIRHWSRKRISIKCWGENGSIQFFSRSLQVNFWSYDVLYPVLHFALICTEKKQKPLHLYPQKNLWYRNVFLLGFSADRNWGIRSAFCHVS